MIEGIGGIMGVLWKQYSGGLQAQYLLCSYKDGVRTSYINKRYNGNCDLISSIGNDPMYQKKIVVYPNPTKDYVSIDNKEGIVFAKLQIVNCLGEIKFLPRESSMIDLTEHPIGIYMLQFISFSGVMYSFSIIKL